jgi:hypothetical protein
MLPALLVLVAALPLDGPFSVEADHLRAARRDGVYLAEGRAVLRRRGLTVHADRLELDRAGGEVRAEGRVVVVDGRSVLSCARARLRLPELTGGLSSVEVRVRAEVDPAGLRGPDLPAGRDLMRLTAERLERSASRRFEVEGGQFTPCRCEPDEAPSWRVEARRASVDLDSGAWLSWPVLYAKDVPVLALPALYVPLGERRSGLLLPRLSASSVVGVELVEPVFLTLGRSWDATLELGYLTARGPRPGLELRWAPSPRSAGWIRAQTLFDAGLYEPAERRWSTGLEDPIVRWSVAARHRSPLAGGQLAVGLNTLGDPNYVGEFADRFLARQVETAASQATWSIASDDGVRAAIGLALRQDLRPSRYPGAALREVRLYSDDPGPGDVRYRFAELRLDAAPTPWLGGALLGEARLSAQAFAAPSPRQPRFARADLRLGVSAPLDLFGLVQLEPGAALRLTAWSGRADRESTSSVRLAPILSTRLGTELWRDFGGWLHLVRPELWHLAIPGLVGEGPQRFETGDELDQLAVVHQVAARLATELWARGERRLALSAWLGRDLGGFGADGAGSSELVLEASALARLGPVAVTADGLAAVALDGALTEVRAGLSAQLASWLGASARLVHFADAVPRRSFVAPEELVPSATLDRSRYLGLGDWRRALSAGDLDVAPWSPFDGVALGLSATPWAPLRFTAGARFDLRIDERVAPSRDGTRLVPPSALRNLAFGLDYRSPCECWSASLTVAQASDRDTPDVRLLVDLAQLGGGSAR